MADIQLIMEVIGEKDMAKAINTAERMEREYKKLDKTFNKNKMSAQQYAKGVAQLDAKYEALTKTTNRLTASTKQHAAAQALAGKRINRMGANLQQVGYQVGDFAVQVQGGTNVMVALGQQGAQLLGIFGAGGALAGAALAIGTALIAPLMRGEKAAKDLTDRIKGLKDEIADIEGRQVLPQEQVDLLAEQETIQIKLISLESQLETKKQAVLSLEEQGITAGGLYLNTQSEVLVVQDKITALEKDRAANSKLLTDYATVLTEKRKALYNQEEAALGREISLLTMIEQFGEDSLAVQRLKKQQALAIYEEELKRLQLHPSILQGLLDQKSVAIDLANAISGAADESARMASNLAISQSFGTLAEGEFSNVPTGLDAFGGGGDYRYDLPSTFRPPKKSKSGGGGGGSKESPAEELQEYLDKLQQQADLESQLVGIFGEKRNTEEEVIKARQKYGKVFTAAQEAELRGTLAQIEADKERQRVLEEAKSQQQSIADTLQSSMSTAFMSMVDGTKSFKDAMKDMARSVIKQLFEILVVQRMVGSFNSTTGKGSGLVGMIMGAFQADGGAWQGGSQIQAYANGGVVGGPTMFPMAGGRTGLMGEAGPEAIMPLKRGANGKLGVQAEGGGGTTVIQNNTFGSGVTRAEVNAMLPKMVEATKAAVADAKLRGGSYGGAFA